MEVVAGLNGHAFADELLPLPLMVGDLEEVGDPAQAALRRDDFEGRETLEDTAEKDRAHDLRVRRDRLGRHLGQPQHLAVPLLRGHHETLGAARANVKIQREVQVLAHRPKRVPIRARNVRVAELLREGEADALDAPLVHAIDLGDGLVDVPQRYGGEGDKPARIRVGVLLDLKVVERLDRLQAIILIEVGIAERVPGYAGDVPEKGVHVDAVLVHRLDPLRWHVGDFRDLFPFH